MEICSLYNVPIQLEKGDLYSIRGGRLLIKVKNKIFISCAKIEKLEMIIYVNSAGILPRDEESFKEIIWKEY